MIPSMKQNMLQNSAMTFWHAFTVRVFQPKDEKSVNMPQFQPDNKIAYQKHYHVHSLNFSDAQLATFLKGQKTIATPFPVRQCSEAIL